MGDPDAGLARAPERVPKCGPLVPNKGESGQEEAGPSKEPRGATSSFLGPVVSAFLWPCIITLALWRSIQESVDVGSGAWEEDSALDRGK